MIKDKKQMIIVIGVFTLVLLLGSVTYAFFNYTRTGAQNTIRVGRISFVSKNEETITLNNLFPIDPSNINEMNDSTKVGTYEIEIKGDTDYVDGIEYLVSVTEADIYTNNGQTVPISLDITVSNGLGTSNANYFTTRENTNASIYKKLVGDTLVGDQMLLVGFIKPNTTSGTIEGIDGKITIKAYLNKNNVVISDTYDGTESDYMGTSNEFAEGKTVISTSEWNNLQSTGISFKVKVEANDGIWVVGSLEEIMRKTTIIDNINSTYVNNQTPGINFGEVSSDTNGKGIYTRSGTENDTYPIMYYRGNITDNNVLFANKCWKTVRTTETGGVKLIYNGLPNAVYKEVPLEESNYTKNTSNTDSRWTFNEEDNTWNALIDDNTYSSIEFTVPADDNYTLILLGNGESSCGGGYYFYKNGVTVKAGWSGWGSEMNLTYDYGTLTSSDVIKMDYMGYDGNPNVTCAVTFKLKMVGQGEKITDNGCNNMGENALISLDINGTPTTNFTFNANRNSPAYNGYMYGDVYTSNNAAATSGAYYGSSFTWDGTNYKLVDAVTTKNNTHHYTCNLTTPDETCTTLRYYFYNNYYINLTGGDSVEEAIIKMQKNINDSIAKDKIDTWYESNMTAFTNNLEDTIWCNDRSIGNNNGWIANGGDLSTYIYYGAGERSNYASNTSIVKNQPSLSCANKNDQFTVNNGNGNKSLDYPIALLTEDEIVFAGGVAGVDSLSFYLNCEKFWWSMSPNNFIYDRADVFDVIGNIGASAVNVPFGLRPAISIKPAQLISKGTGTVSDPYIIE